MTLARLWRIESFELASRGCKEYGLRHRETLDIDRSGGYGTASPNVCCTLFEIWSVRGFYDFGPPGCALKVKLTLEATLCS